MISEKRNLLCARECAVLFQDAARVAVLDGITNKPKDSTSLAHALDRLDEFERSGGEVLFDVLMSLPPERFHIPSSFPCGQRYEATISGSSCILRLEELRDRLSAAEPSMIRPMYLNYAVRVALRAAFALSHKEEFSDALVSRGVDPEGL